MQHHVVSSTFNDTGQAIYICRCRKGKNEAKGAVRCSVECRGKCLRVISQYNRAVRSCPHTQNTLFRKKRPRCYGTKYPLWYESNTGQHGRSIVI